MASPKIIISFGANTKKLKGDLDKAEGIVGKFTKAAKGALIGMGVAAAGAAVAIGEEAVQAAIQDQASAAKLAKTLKNTTAATELQTAAVEDYILKTEIATGIVDDKLRPSLDRLVRSTHNVKEAEKLQTVAMDISAGTGKDLQAVTEALAKAHDGNFAALKRMGVPLDDNITKTKDFQGAVKELAKTFEGQSATASNTMAGKMERIKRRIDEAKESLGYLIMDGLQPLVDWVLSPEGGATITSWIKTTADGLKTTVDMFKTINGWLDNKFVQNPLGLNDTQKPKGNALEIFQKGTGQLDEYLNGDSRAMIQNSARTWGSNVQNITIQMNSVDPASAAKAVKLALAKAQRLAVTNQVGRGMG
jgi:hypothetical protein